MKNDDTWEARMAWKAAASQRAEDYRRCFAIAKIYELGPPPLDDDFPACCWANHWSGGWTLKCICDLFRGGCDHKHHEGQVWMAA
jgi:hypothetical protein